MIFISYPWHHPRYWWWHWFAFCSSTWLLHCSTSCRRPVIVIVIDKEGNDGDDGNDEGDGADDKTKSDDDMQFTVSYMDDDIQGTKTNAVDNAKQQDETEERTDDGE